MIIRHQGLKRGVGHPAAFYHPGRDIKTLVHGDVYVSSGMSEQLDWLQGEMENTCRIKTQRTRPHGREQVEANIMNRVVRRTENRGTELRPTPDTLNLSLSNCLNQKLERSGLREPVVKWKQGKTWISMGDIGQHIGP